MRGMSHEFEDVLEEEHKYEKFMSKPSVTSVEIGMDNPSPLIGQEASTDVRNLVDFQNIGCNTQINTDEK